MKIIRDEEMGGLAMIPLLVDWHIRRCNVVGCREKPNTIVLNAGPDNNLPAFGLCEKHFQQGYGPGGAVLMLECDDYDAFKQEAPCAST